MGNLTVVIDDDVLRKARIRALQEGTSVNAICREAIARFAAPAVAEEDDFLTQLRAVSRRIDKGAARSAGAGPLWPGREALYERVLDERMPTLMATLKRGSGSKPKKP